jgi:lysophospholipase L1-like esterase
MASRARRVGRAWLGAAAFVLGLALAEIGLRVYARLTRQERGLTWHADFGWAYLPGIEKRGRWWSARELARTNSRGWRDAETELERCAGTQRILALGDSFTFGMAVDYGERFTEILERDVPAMEVVNLGLNAAGTDQELRILEVEGLRYRPDVVVLVALPANDLLDIRNDRKNGFSKPSYRLEGDGLVLVEPTLDVGTRLRCASYVAEVAMRGIDRFRRTTRVADAWQGRDTVPLFAALVRRMDAIVGDARAKFLVAMIYPSGYETSGVPADEQRARRALEDAGVALLDTFETFAGPTRRGEVLYAADGHWNAEGHALFARTLQAELARRGWLAP